MSHQLFTHIWILVGTDDVLVWKSERKKHLKNYETEGHHTILAWLIYWFLETSKNKAKRSLKCSVSSRRYKSLMDLYAVRQNRQNPCNKQLWGMWFNFKIISCQYKTCQRHDEKDWMICSYFILPVQWVCTQIQLRL